MVTMIKSYQVEQNLNTTDGVTADISFGLRATGVPVSIAHEIENEFSKFMGRVTGGSVTMTQATTRTLEWSPEELDSIRSCNTVAEARRKYREAFPDSSRSKQAVKTKFAELRKKPAKPDISAGGLSGLPAAVPAEIPKTPAAKIPAAEKPAPVKKPGKKAKASNIGNFSSGRWSDDEKALVDSASDPDTAWLVYQQKFPGMRNQNAIYQRWVKNNKAGKKTTGKKNGRPPKKKATPTPAAEDEPVKEFTEAEDASIAACPSEEMALMRYQDKFPDSPRTAVEVSMRWQYLRGSGTEEAVAGEAA
jgi:hypothetical protein